MATLNQRLWDHGSVRFGAAVLLFVLLLYIVVLALALLLVVVLELL